MRSTRKKSINLILIIVMLILLVLLIIFVPKILKNTKEDDIKDNTASISISVKTGNEVSYNPINDLNNFQTIDTASSSNEENTINTNSISNDTSTPEITNTEQTTELNNHIYKLPSSLKFSKKLNSLLGNELLLEYPDYEFEMIYNTKTESFEKLKTESYLRSYLETNFGTSISGDIKTGNIKKLDIIACEISENSKKGYFIITPLNESEIIYTKIFNTADTSSLIEDLSKPLEEITSMKTYIQN